MKGFYLVLAILGTAVPYAAFVPWLIQHGVDIPLLLQHAIANPISLFAWLDVIISAIALLGFIIVDGGRHRVPYRVFAIIGTLTIGVSCGLPPYLYLKERHKTANL